MRFSPKGWLAAKVYGGSVAGSLLAFAQGVRNNHPRGTDMTRPNLKSLTPLLGGLLLATTPAVAQRSRSTPTPPAPPPPAVGPTIVIAGEEATPPPPTDSRSARRSRSSSRSDAALQLLWPRLGAGNADTIDVNSNPRLRLLLPSMGVSVPRDGILRKPRAMTATASAPSGSAQPPDVGPIAINLDGNYLLPEPPSPDGGPVVVVTAGQGATVVSSAPAPPPTNSRSSSDRRSGDSGRYWSSSWSRDERSDDDRSGDPQRAATASADGDDADDEDRPEVVRHDNLPKTAPNFWQAFDTNHDAQLSLFEWRTGGKSVEEFVALDVNQDGQLVLDEYADGVAAEVIRPAPAPSPSRFSRYRR